METITIHYHNGLTKTIERPHYKGTYAMDILIMLNQQGHGVHSVSITAK